MSFIPQDLYLTSGTVGIINDWQATVTKFDSSSFYNWEEDNMPVYDLEDRTSYLWERIGYPVRDGFSGIPGKMFVVSADYGFPVGQDSSGIIFRDLSSVINVLPNPITYPIIIEVASFGNIGELKLNNIKNDVRNLKISLQEAADIIVHWKITNITINICKQHIIFMEQTILFLRLLKSLMGQWKCAD
jgi:hypothetical protein